MPRPGSVPQPEFASTGTYGEAAAANVLQDAVPSFLGELPLEPEPDEDFAPAGPDEAFLASPSDFPEMPLSAGAPFGPGAPGVAPRVMSDQEYLVSQIRRLPVQSLPPRIQGFLRRVAAGE